MDEDDRAAGAPLFEIQIGSNGVSVPNRSRVSETSSGQTLDDRVVPRLVATVTVTVAPCWSTISQGGAERLS